ncbi:transporter substrate-binding domain-containing diguanylate cyclase [Aeromonas piscicola]|jgi:diguanylate cyclase (GGDEF)-like protein|uniref:transporter substrate-binding domain-containing diguanylate cyclase n=1 Tax=Aeromonas piscicola TaxID=600645 RepID=UPI0005B4A49C|nr:sensor domain-containing diguanylate cyclase [Aeromonas piscicola]
MAVSSGFGWRVRSGCCLLLCLLWLPAWATPTPKPLIVTNSKAWQPFSYINEEGQPDGLLIDLWREYGRVTGRPIQFKLVDWQTSLDLVRTGKADVHGGLLWSPERNPLYDYGQGLSRLDSQLFFANSLRGTDVNYYLQHESVGVVAGGYEEYYARKHFPTTRLQTFTDNDAMLRAAFSGELDAFIADLQVANFYIYTSADPSRFIPVRHLYSDEIRFAVAKGNQALLQELELGFSRLGVADRERIIRKWMHIETVYPLHLWPWLLALGGMVLLVYIVQLRRAVAGRTAELIQANARLERLAGTDSMTGILNRRAFLPEFEQRLASGQASGLLLFDIDRFKGINDHFGHGVGDEVLSALVERVRLVLPDGALFARIGGEEFCISLPMADMAALQAWASRIGREVSLRKLQTSAGELGLSISTGAVWMPDGVRADGRRVLLQADRLMYGAKSLGRNTWQAACYAEEKENAAEE